MTLEWMKPFRRQTENTRTRWGYTYEWTPEHPTPETMHPLKFTYDVLGERALERLNEISPPPRSVLPRSHSAARRGQDVKEEETRSQRDLFVILRDNKDDPTLSPLWEEVNKVPEWVDWEQLSRGQDVFYRYGGANLTGLAYQSLLGGMGAARVVETLARTGGFSTKVARRRLYETTQHILQVTKSLESVQPGGEGWASTIRVRLLHAAVRQRILKLAKERPEYYSVEKFGIPINDLDSLATIGTFSATLIWLALPRQGLFLRQNEISDYLALWRYVGYVIGAPTDTLPWFADARYTKMLMESLLYYEIAPSDTSKVLAHNLIRCLEDRPPLYATDSVLIASARWLNGHELCDRLALKRVPVYYMALMAGQCIFFMVMCYVYRSIPSWDRWKIEFLRKGFWTMIVESGSGLKGEVTGFEFKYIPELATVTERDDSEEVRERDSGIESRNLRWLVIFVAGIGFASWLGIRVTIGVARRILG